MKLTRILLLATAGTLVTGISYFSANSGYGSMSGLAMASAGEEEEVEGEEGEARDFAGALESVYSLKLNEKTGTIDPAWVQHAISQADALRINQRASNLVWENMGPDNVGGRIRAFLLHRDSANIMFAGSVSGGLFRSNTNGQSWKPVDDLAKNLSVTCIAQAVDGTIYYGTGEGGFTNLGGNRNGSPAFPGGGIFKSTDSRGTSFTLLSNTTGGGYDVCNAMVAHPTLNKVFVATENGLMVTANSGSSWTVAKSGNFKDLAVDKNGVVWAANSAGAIFKSDASGVFSGGTMNSSANGFAPSGSRTAIAVSPQDPDYVYAMAAQSGRMYGVFRSTNGGQNWEKIVEGSTPQIINAVTDVFGSNTQGWYDNVICVDPENKNRCYLGGVVLASWDNTNGFREMGSTFDAPWNNQYVHADKHVIQFDTRTSPATMIVGCDGGLYFSQNRSTWTPRNRGFTSLQLYNVAANSLGWLVGGAQDNGTQLINFSGNAWENNLSKTAIEIYGGDGFDAEFSSIFPKTIFVSTYYGTVARTSNSGQSSSTFWDKRIQPDAAVGIPRSDFNTTFTLWEDPTDSSSILFLAKDDKVWAAINPTDFTKEVSWFLVASGMGSDRIVEMEHTADGDHLFICKPGTPSRLYRLDNIQSANFSTSVYPGANDIPSPLSLVNITPAGLSGRFITSANVDPANPDHVIVTLGGYGNAAYVYESKNALSPTPSWTNITGDLPSAPVYDAIVDVDNAKHIIIGTEFGVWETTNGGTNWVEANNGMARVPVFEIRGYEFHPWEGTALYLGTHGRGYYRSTSLLTGTKKASKNNISITAYPNPASNVVNIGFNATSTASALVEIYSLNGSLVASSSMKANAGDNQMPVNVASYTNGYYFARITIGNNTKTVKFLVNH